MHYHFAPVFEARDSKRYFPYTFELPAGCDRLELRFGYSPGRVGGIDNVLSLTLFDPQGFRGAWHCRGPEQAGTIEVRRASPGMRAGPLPAGTWTAQIETHGVQPGEACRCELDILAEMNGVDPGKSAPVAHHAVAAPEQVTAGPAGEERGSHGPGWYRGDLHTHTEHSDADIDVTTRVRAAQRLGLDFLFLTDHNTVTGIQEMQQVPSPGLLKLGGIELTTYFGHALCLGTCDWVDWRVDPQGSGMADIARQATAAGQLFIISHPRSADDPICTGCAWHYDQVMPGPARLVEVWNGHWVGDSGNEANLALWYGWLNQGLRMVATAGTDDHEGYPTAAGLGFNIVRARSLSEAALLEAMREGHLYLSAGPRLTLAGRPDSEGEGRLAMMGDSLAGPAPIVACHWEDTPPGSWLRVIVDGEVRHCWPGGGGGQRHWPLQPGEDHWCVVEVRDEHDSMLALTNPIFLGETE
jgi:hypothetical protein